MFRMFFSILAVIFRVKVFKIETEEKLSNELYKKKEDVQFKPEILEESTMYLQNPSCGWYHIYPFVIEEKPNFEELYWCLHAEERIALALIDIGAFREGEISRRRFAISRISWISSESTTGKLFCALPMTGMGGGWSMNRISYRRSQNICGS